MKSSVDAWLRYAEKDLLAAKRLEQDENLANISCFHSQQCVEKSLKAILEDQEVIPPKTHDLIRLYGMVQVHINIDEDMLARLNETYLDSRYPLTLGHLPQGFPSVEESKIFYEFARQVYNRISEILNIKSS